MYKLINILAFVFLFTSCSKDETILPVQKLEVRELSSINKTTSQNNSLFIPFVDYWTLSGTPHVSCSDIFGRTFLNINNNNIPDLVFTITNGCGFNNGKVYVFVDNVLKWTFEHPQVLTRKISRGDFNEDGYDDVVLFGHGHDGPPFPGDKNYIIYFTPSTYSLVLLDPASAYHHTGTVGDINNDGHVDIIPIANQMKDCFAFLNDGKGNFTKKKIFDGKYTDVSFQTELYDINHDGNLDMIMGGHEWSDYDWQVPTNRIIFGDGKGNFNTSNSINLPTSPGWGVITDFDIYDFDNDGIEEIVVTRTSGSKGSSNGGSKKNPNGFYDDFRIQILKKNGTEYIEHSFLSSPSGWEKTICEWMIWVSVKDVDNDGFADIVPDNDRLNNRNYTSLLSFNRLYYKGDGKNNFTPTIKK